MNFAEVLFALTEFFLLFAAFWIFIGIFADIFKRHDMSGGKKALWVLALILFPIVGGLVYIVVRPARSDADAQMVRDYEAQRQAKPTTSMGEEIVKLSALHETGAISDEEFARLKQQAL